MTSALRWQSRARKRARTSRTLSYDFLRPAWEAKQSGGRVWWKMPQRLELDGYNAPKLKAYIQTNVLIRQTKRSQSVVTYACNSAHVPPSLSKGARIPGKTWATQIESGKKESEAGKLVILWLREECPNRHEPAKKNNKRFPPTPFSHLQTHTSNYTLTANTFEFIQQEHKRILVQLFTDCLIFSHVSRSQKHPPRPSKA